MRFGRRFSPLWILPLLLVLLPAAACSDGADDNDAASSTEYSELASDSPAPCDSHVPDAGAEPPTFVLVPVPMPPAVVVIDPVSPTVSELMRFKLVNRGSHELFAEEFGFDFSMVCRFMQTVRLETGNGVLSDGDCRAMTTFTVDTSIPPGESETFSVTVVPRTDFEGLLHADQAIREREAFVVDLVSILTPFGRTELDPRYPSNEISLSMSNECQWEGEGCAEAWEGEPLLEVSLCNEQEPLFRIARNDLFIVPFSVAARDIIDLGTSEVTFIFRIEGPTTLSASVSEIGGSGVSAVAEENGELVITVPVSESTAHYRLFASAPGYRGDFRLILESANIGADDGISVIGCYPQRSQTFLLLPRTEWESLL